MQKNKLYIQDINEDWLLADLGADEIAFTYQINDLATLEDRQASYSQAVTLPFSPFNKFIFRNADDAQTAGKTPYRQLPCRLYANDLLISGKDAVIYLDEITDDGYSCQIVSGSRDFYELLESKVFDEVAEVSPDFLGHATITTSPTTTAPGAVATCYVQDPLVPRWWLFLGLYRATAQMLHYLGYSVTTNLTTAQMNKYFSVPTMKALPSGLTAFSSKGALLDNSFTIDEAALGIAYEGVSYPMPFALTQGTYGRGALIPPTQSIGGFRGLAPTTYNQFEAGLDPNVTASSGNPYQFRYIPATDGKIKITIEASGAIGITPDALAQPADPTSPDGLFNALGFFITQGTNTSDLSATLVFNKAKLLNENALTDISDMCYTVELDVTKNEPVNIFACLHLYYCQAFGNHADYSFSVVQTEGDNVPEGGTLYFSNNTGFDTFKDLFKACLQTFGLTAIIDKTNKTVELYTFKELYDNKAQAPDWSGKLLRGERTQSFALDNYAQRNTIAYKDKDDITDEGVFTVDNDNLEASKELFSLDWQAGKDFNGLAIIPLYDGDTSGTLGEFKGTDAHLVTITGGEVSHATAQSIIDTYYSELTDGILKNAKIIEAEFLLTDMDIKNFQPMTPVYVSQFGGYYYVNKIDNYISGKNTKVELIKL